MHELVCQFCGLKFHSNRRKKYCTKTCCDRNSRGTNPINCRTDTAISINLRNRELVKSGVKRCTECLDTKPLSSYKFAKAGLGERKSWCKKCCAKYKRQKRYESGGRPRHELTAESKFRRVENRVKARREKRLMVWGRLWLTDYKSPADAYRERYKNCPEFNLSERVRRQINKAAKRDEVAEYIRGAIRRGGDSPKTKKLLGYSVRELMRHLELQFTKDMDWDRFKSGDIHIDHIIPQKEFDLTDDDEWKACWSMANLRPLWAKDNLSKGGAVETLL